MKKILIISEKNNFIVNSMRELLEEMGHNVVHTEHHPDEMRQGFMGNVRLILLWADALSMEGMIYIKDRIIEDSIPIYIAGDRDHVARVKEIIPTQYIKCEFCRPVDIKEVVAAADKFIREDKSHLKKKILVVDDSGAMLRSVKGWLEDKYQVILASSGAMAIKYLAMSRPDLVLLDYEMPVCDGKQVLEMIRAESEFSNVPVVFLTNKNDRESVLSVSSLKPEGYLLKTMEPRQIVATIDEYFEKKKWML